ncbi:MAG: hypothetical protein WBM98_17470 [Maribacter sp.]|uniref:hypothetical protein n=1 Tax=Maribacter sp. TaxID=1897614 RepID=UPI003C7416CC
MFAKLTTAQRIQVGLILAMAFLLVLGSNRLDQKHFSTIQNTVNSVHEDRVVVQDFIYQLSKIAHRKELRFVQNGVFELDASENQKINQLLVDFGMTKLTPKESNLLDQMTRQFAQLEDLENKIANPTTVSESDFGILAHKILHEITQNLDGLAEIQLSESAQLTQRSQKSLGMNIMLSKLEVAFMIVIGIAMLFLIFMPVKTMHMVQENEFTR